MTAGGGQGWRGPAEAAASVRMTAVPVAPLSWWYVTWRARVLDESTGNVETRLSAVADAMAQLDSVGRRPLVHLLSPSSVSIEFWFEAASAREAAGAARAALRQAFGVAGVGDPTPHRSRGVVDVMLMLEELPTLHQQDESTRGDG
jgi:hypothetical protein